MRTSKRSNILDAALRITEERGIGAVTLEAVADRAELTKGGLMYHFPTKEALLLGIHQHLAEQWEAAMERAAGTTAAEAAPIERFKAYVQVAATSATRAELMLMLDASDNEALMAPWRDVARRWAPTPDLYEGPDGMTLRIALLAADGLWVNQPVGWEPNLTQKARQEVAEHLLRLIDD